MLPHPKDIFLPFPSYCKVSSYPEMQFFSLIIYSTWALVFCETKNCSYSERLCFKLNFRFKHVTAYKQLLVNVLLQNIITYGLLIKNCTILTKTVGTVEIKYSSTEKKISKLYLLTDEKTEGNVSYHVNYFILLCYTFNVISIGLLVFVLLLDSFKVLNHECKYHHYYYDWYFYQ